VTDQDFVLRNGTPDYFDHHESALLSPADSDLEEERFVICEIIAEGGTASVYRAWDALLHRHVALKVLQVDSGCSELNLRHETVISQQLSHPAIVRTHDIVLVKNTMCVSMEFIDGPNLSQLIASNGHLNTHTAVTIARQICSGLSCAHNIGIIHCDLKPGNILLDKGMPRIADFGLAIDTNTSIKTALANGTTLYMSPEQKQGLPVDHRTDIYSLGVLLYEMLTGHLPSQKELIAPTANSLVKSIAGSPQPLRAFVAKCLQTRPEDRYLNAEAMIAALDEISIETRLRILQRLKSQIRRWRYYLIGTLLLGPLAAVSHFRYTAAQGRTAPHDLETIMVLPISSDDNSRDIADGVDDYLLSVLYQTPSVRVWSTMRGTHRSITPTAYSAADYVIEGRAIKAGEYCSVTLTVTARKPVVKTLTMHIAAGTLLELQRKVSRRFADEHALAGLHIEAWIPREYEGRLSTAFGFYQQANTLLRWNSKSPIVVDRAIKFLTTAIKQDPSCSICFAKRAEAETLLYKRSQLRQYRVNAVQDSHRAAALDDLSGPVTLTAVNNLVGLGDMPAATTLLNRAQKPLALSSSAHRMMGEILLSNELYPYAIEELKQAVVLNPIDASAIDSLGFAELMLPDYDQAIYTLTRLVSLDPNDAAAQTNLADALLRAGRFEEAIHPLRVAVQKQPSGAGYSNLGMALFYTGQHDDALACFERAATLEPTAEFVGNLAHVYRWLGLDAKATTQYKLALSTALQQMRTGPSGLMLSDISLFYAALGKKELALAYMQLARRKSPLNLDVVYKEAVAMNLLGMREKAIEDLQTIVDRGYPMALAAQNPDLLTLHSFPEFQRLKQRKP
jgi:eukaryotic-like serine/threonine-protein kinase